MLSYDPNDVFLTLVRNDITFASLAQTRNQLSVANALDRSAPLDPVVQAVANLTPAGALQAFDALSGEVHASAQATIIDDSRYARQAILGRLRQAPYAGGAGAMATLGAGGPMLAYANPAADGALVYPEGYLPAYPIKSPLRAPAEPGDFTFWAQGVGAWGKINSDGNAADVSRNLGGVFTGFDRQFGDWRAGLAAGYTTSSVSVPARASSANIDTGYFAAYGGTNFGAWNVRSGAVFAWNTIATSRSIAFPGFAEQANVRYGAAESQVFGELGYGIDFGNAAAEPFAGLAWVHLNTNDFFETGGVSALSGSSNTNDVGYSTLGARWAANYLMPNGMMLTPRASLAWQHAYGTVTPTAALGFRDTGTAFGIWGVPIARDAALVEAGGDLQLSAQTKLGVSYVGQLATNAHDHSVMGNFTWRFADGPLVTPIKAADSSPSYYDWSGFYVGAHLGYGWGRSNWSEAPDIISDSFSLAKPYDAFQGTGSYFAGVQAGYDYMLANRLFVGVVVDASAPSFPNLDGISIGGSSLFTSPSLGPQTYSETMLIFGTARGRVGYAPGDWLLYATGGYAWTYNQAVVNQLGSGPTDSPFLWRVGWVAGAGVEFPVAPHWTASLEYLYTHYGHAGTFFPNAGQAFDSDFSMQQLRLGLNYRFGDVPRAATLTGPTMPDPDLINFHGQATFSGQGYPSFRSPYEGINSLPGVSRPREVFDATLYAGLRLWQGGELWVSPEIDEGHGLALTHGVAGFTSAEAYKVGLNYPYARIPRAFVRQTIDLGGKPEKVDADISTFAGTQTENRLVLTVGKFAVVDIFDTNRYANNPKLDFLNWSHVQNGTFDYAADGWGYTYGAAAEWYQGRWTLRAGVFDLSKTPTGGVSPDGINLDSSFHQFQLVGEVEERHELWGQPGKIKITGFLSRGRAGDFADAVAVAQATGQPADINSVRVYRSRPGVSVNLEQQVSDSVGIFARAGWADGSVEPWDFTDIDRAVSGGVWLSGKLWGREYDNIGVAATVNGISSIHQQFFNLGGLGILIGDGQLPNAGLERIIEAYYSYAFTPATRVTFDYQFITNPAYNTDRGPVSVFGMRLHAQF